MYLNDETYYENQSEHSGQQPAQTSPIAISAPIKMLTTYSQQHAGMNNVMRSLISHRNWFAPLSMFPNSGEPTRRAESALMLSTEARITPGELWIFTDREAALRAQAAGALLGTYAGNMSGTELFRKIPLNTTVVRVNPYSPLEYTWTFRDGGGIEAGVIWAEAIALEESFEQWEQSGKPDSTAFLNYRAFLTFDNSSGRVVTLPNQFGMSNPAVAFTAPDCAAHFLSEIAEEQSAELRQVTIAGKTLFEKAPVLGIDGLVINIFGPGATYDLPFNSIRSNP